MNDSPSPIPWHALSSQEIFIRLNSRPSGLNAEEAAERLTHFGPNRLPPPRKRGPLRRFLIQFHNVLIYILIGFLQEGKAERALESQQTFLSLQAVALRDGTRKPIPAEELVPGDIVFLQAGDKVPADLRLLHVRELQVEEAILTGESLPARKRIDAVAATAPPGRSSRTTSTRR